VGRLKPLSPLAPSSVQVDTGTFSCPSIGSNEESVAQSSVNPDLVVVAAQAFFDGTNCSDSHPLVFYSHDGGQHWLQQVIPGLDRTAGGATPTASRSTRVSRSRARPTAPPGATTFSWTQHGRQQLRQRHHPAFDANGELMTAYWSCNGVDSLREDLSTDDGSSWSGSDVTVSTISPVDGAGGCLLDTPATGSQFRCNNFPAVAGDPNASDAGGRAFAIVWTNAEFGIAQNRGLSTADAGASWTNAFYGASNNNGDKFFPSLSIAVNGRVGIGYSSREGSATPENPKGTTFNEHHTEAASLARLRGGTSGEFVTYSIDDTPSDPSSLDFIGDYSGQASQDNSLDTYPVWTDLRDGSPNTRTSQLCYANCYTPLAPDQALTFSHPTGSSFTDRLRFNTDPGFGGDGTSVWNVVGIRNGDDSTVIDNDMTLFNDRYFSAPLATSSFSPPFADYLLETTIPAMRRASPTTSTCTASRHGTAPTRCNGTPRMAASGRPRP
jgi:hypothetical protein